MKPLVVSIVSYYNTIPLLYGLERFMPPGSIQIECDIPSVCASKLISGHSDISLCPTGALLQINDARIIGNHCIGAENDVATVVLLSQCPVNGIEEIYLDADSRTSNLLVQVLASKKWGIQPRWLSPKPNYHLDIHGKRAGVMIGNKVFSHKNDFAFCTDLAHEWIALTSLPFVFACWASRKEISSEFVEMFEKAQENGIAKLHEAIENYGVTFSFDIHSYLTKNIKFNLDNAKRDAIKLFASYCKSSNIVI